MVRRTVEMPEWMLMAPLVLAMALLVGEFIFRLAGRSRPASAATTRARSPDRARRARLARGRASPPRRSDGAHRCIGPPVAFAFLAINIVGAIALSRRRPGLKQLARNSVASLNNFSLTPIPFFILMGEVLFHPGVAMKAIDAVDRAIRRVPGRLAMSRSSPAQSFPPSPARPLPRRRCSARSCCRRC